MRNNFNVQGFLWGSDMTELCEHGLYDLVILSDVVFNHSEHKKLLKSIRDCLSVDGEVLCTFTHHRPWLADKDMDFFKLAHDEYQIDSVHCESVIMGPMFEVDRGDVEVRSTVHFYKMNKRK